MSKNGVIAAVVVGLVMATGSPIATTARAAADCPAGEFCVWTETGFKGRRGDWSGDGAWANWISGDDSSWADHGVPGSGAKDHVEVFDQGGQVTICLSPGEEVDANAAANDRGRSHAWTMSC